MFGLPGILNETEDPCDKNQGAISRDSRQLRPLTGTPEFIHFLFESREVGVKKSKDSDS